MLSNSVVEFDQMAFLTAVGFCTNLILWSNFCSDLLYKVLFWRVLEKQVTRETWNLQHSDWPTTINCFRYGVLTAGVSCLGVPAAR